MQIVSGMKWLWLTNCCGAQWYKDVSMAHKRYTNLFIMITVEYLVLIGGFWSLAVYLLGNRILSICCHHSLILLPCVALALSWHHLTWCVYPSPRLCIPREVTRRFWGFCFRYKHVLFSRLAIYLMWRKFGRISVHSNSSAILFWLCVFIWFENNSLYKTDSQLLMNNTI